MNNNQKLIEEAAQAMANAPHAGSWDAHTEDEREWYRKDAAIALVVFEKAIGELSNAAERLEYGISAPAGRGGEDSGDSDPS